MSRPFDREPRLGLEGAVQETLEGFDLGETIEQRHRVDRIGRARGTAPSPRHCAATDVPRARRHERSRGPRSSSRPRGSAARHRTCWPRHRPAGTKSGSGGARAVRHRSRRGWPVRATGRRAGQSRAGPVWRRGVRSGGWTGPDSPRPLPGAAPRIAGGGGRRRGLRLCRGRPRREDGSALRVHRIRVLQIPLVQLEHVRAVNPCEPLPVRHTPTILPSLVAPWRAAACTFPVRQGWTGAGRALQCSLYRAKDMGQYRPKILSRWGRRPIGSGGHIPHLRY